MDVSTADNIMNLTAFFRMQGGVVMQLLVPFLHEMAGNLLDVMAMHDIEHLIPDFLAFAAPSQGRQDQTDQSMIFCGPAIARGKFAGETVQGVTQITGLGVVVSLPVELSDT